MENTPPPPISSSVPPPPPPPPPSYTPPPIIMAPSPSPPPRRGRGWMVFALLLLGLLILSLLGNFGQMLNGFTPVSSGYTRHAGPRMDEVLLKDNRSHNKIAVIDVEGIIRSDEVDQGGFTMVDLIRGQLERAKKDEDVKAVVLRVDSPGGEVLASDEIYRALLDFQKQSDKPVITSMGSLAASGGYYIAAASRWIVANELTITGSIGVILHTWNYRQLMNKVGVAPQVFKSGKHKDMLSGDRDLDKVPPEELQAEKDMVNGLINETYVRFKAVVAEGRGKAHEENQSDGKALVSNWAEYADGRILSGSQAFEYGFVDSLGNFDDAVEKAKELGSVDEANLIKYQQRYDLSDFFRVFGQSEGKSVKVNVGFEPPNLQAGYLYFLSPTFMQ